MTKSFTFGDMSEMCNETKVELFGRNDRHCYIWRKNWDSYTIQTMKYGNYSIMFLGCFAA